MNVAKWLKPLLVFVVTAVVLVRCSNDVPVTSRFDLIGNNAVGSIVRLDLQPPAFDSSASRVVNTGSGALLQLGAYNNTNSRFLIRFGSLPSGATARSAVLILPTYRVLGSGAAFEATAHPLSTNWSELGVTQDSIGSAYGAIVGSQTVTTADSDTVSIALDPSLVTGWMNSTISNYGVLVQAPNAPFAKQLHARNSSAAVPVLRLAYTNNGVDSTKDVASDRDAFIFEILQPPPAGPLYVTNGTYAHALVKFDLSAIGKGATINRAQLVLVVDPANTRLTTDGVVMRLFRVVKDNRDPLNAPLDSSSVLDASKFVSDSSTVISFSIASTVQNWLREQSDLLHTDNFGVVVLPATPEEDLQQIGFYSTKTNPGLAPSLVVDYTLPSNAQ